MKKTKITKKGGGWLPFRGRNKSLTKKPVKKPILDILFGRNKKLEQQNQTTSNKSSPKTIRKPVKKPILDILFGKLCDRKAGLVKSEEEKIKLLKNRNTHTNKERSGLLYKACNYIFSDKFRFTETNNDGNRDEEREYERLKREAEDEVKRNEADAERIRIAAEDEAKRKEAEEKRRVDERSRRKAEENAEKKQAIKYAEQRRKMQEQFAIEKREKESLEYTKLCLQSNSNKTNKLYKFICDKYSDTRAIPSLVTAFKVNEYNKEKADLIQSIKNARNNISKTEFMKDLENLEDTYISEIDNTYAARKATEEKAREEADRIAKLQANHNAHTRLVSEAQKARTAELAELKRKKQEENTEAEKAALRNRFGLSPKSK